MEVFDLQTDPSISQLSDLLRRVSEATDPMEIQRAFGANMRERSGADAYVSLSCRGLADGQFKVTRAQFGPEVGAAYANPWHNWSSMPAVSGGFLGEIIRTPTPKLVTGLDIRSDSVLGDRLQPYGACLAAPLFDGGKALNWGLVFRERSRAASAQEVGELLLRGNLIGGMTKNLLVASQVRALNAKLAAQLEEIAQIQRTLLPSQSPKVPGLSIATSYLTSNEAGGDYFDFFDMGDDHWGVMIADVAGHGAGAATVMAMLQTILHGYQERRRGPAAMLEHTNRELKGKRFELSFVTAFMGVFDPERRVFTYTNAGHNRPKFRSASGSVRRMEGAVSLPLGILDNPEYEEAQWKLGPNDTIVMYTDGITEAFSPPPEREMFGVERLTGAIQACTGDPACVIDRIHETLYDHTKVMARQDDQTIVALRVLE